LSVQVVEAHLRRIEQVNPSINAVVILLVQRRARGRRGQEGLAPIYTDIRYGCGGAVGAQGSVPRLRPKGNQEVDRCGR
jgi:hypothetical protein